MLTKEQAEQARKRSERHDKKDKLERESIEAELDEDMLDLPQNVYNHLYLS